MIMLLGCNNGDDQAVKTEPPSNPSGIPRTPEEKKVADLQMQSGEHAKEQMAAAAKAMADAKSKAGAP